MQKWIAILVVLAFAACSANAAMLSEGTKELVIEGLLDFDTADDTLLEIGVAHGVFISDGTEVGVEGSFSDSDSVTIWTLGVFGEQNFDQGTEVVPFVGAAVSYANAEVETVLGDVDDDAIVGSVYAGLKYFIVENIAVSGRLVYQMATEDIFANGDDLEDDDLVIDLGMRFFY